MVRVKQRDPSLNWSDCTVLARTRDELAPVRALCEQRGIPIIWGIDERKTPPLTRLREVRRFFAELKSRHDELLSSVNLLSILDDLIGERQTNIWWELMRDVLNELRDETNDAQLPMSYFIEYVYEALAEQKREQAVGRGVFLSTVHSAKGMEFSHVFVLGGGWKKEQMKEKQEEERRVYYVAMTRAKETLCLFERFDIPNPNTCLLEGDFVVKRDPSLDAPPDDLVLRRRYDILGMEDLTFPLRIEPLQTE